MSTTEVFENENKISWREVTNFYGKKDPKLDSNHTCLAISSLDSALRKDDNYYL